MIKRVSFNLHGYCSNEDGILHPYIEFFDSLNRKLCKVYYISEYLFSIEFSDRVPNPDEYEIIYRIARKYMKLVEERIKKSREIVKKINVENLEFIKGLEMEANKELSGGGKNAGHESFY